MDNDLHHSVIEPVLLLAHRLRQNIYTEAAVGDVTEAAKRAVISVYHFRERRVGTMRLRDALNEAHRQVLADVADTAKHGVLKDRDRTVRLSAGMQFEVDERGWFRFREIVVTGRNRRHGKFDLITSLLAVSIEVAAELGWQVNVVEHPVDGPFEEWATTYLPAGFVAPRAIELLTVKLGADGRFSPVDVPEVRLKVIDGTDPLLGRQPRLGLGVVKWQAPQAP
jgi:hypothetical protein